MPRRRRSFPLFSGIDKRSKFQVASDDSHRDLASIDIKLLRHEAFEAEMRANAGRVEAINKVREMRQRMTRECPVRKRVKKRSRRII